MWTKILALLAIAFISGVLYRMGGKGKPFASWMRDWVCPACVLGALFLFYRPSFTGYLLCIPAYALMGAALSTYFGFVNPWLKKKEEDKYWWNYFLHGFFAGLALFPLINSALPFHLILIRAVTTGILMAVWSQLISIDWLEEWGRGVSLVITVPLLVI